MGGTKARIPSWFLTIMFWLWQLNPRHRTPPLSLQNMPKAGRTPSCPVPLEAWEPQPLHEPPWAQTQHWPRAVRSGLQTAFRTLDMRGCALSIPDQTWDIAVQRQREGPQHFHRAHPLARSHSACSGAHGERTEVLAASSLSSSKPRTPLARGHAGAFLLLMEFSSSPMSLPLHTVPATGNLDIFQVCGCGVPFLWGTLQHEGEWEVSVHLPPRNPQIQALALLMVRALAPLCDWAGQESQPQATLGPQCTCA